MNFKDYKENILNESFNINIGDKISFKWVDGSHKTGIIKNILTVNDPNFKNAGRDIKVELNGRTGKHILTIMEKNIIRIIKD